MERISENTCYRNHQHRHGVEDLIIRLIKEVPQFKEEKSVVIEIEILKTILYTINEQLKLKRYVDYNFYFNPCLYDYG